jgi:unsaturated rhamnogalacturonyl hydrolase
MSSKTLRELVECVADYTLTRDMESEEWQKSVAVNGLLAIGEEEYIEAARRLIDRSIETQISTGQLSYGSLDPDVWEGHEGVYQSQTDPASLGRGVLNFYERTSDEWYLKAARKEYEFLQNRAQRTVDDGIAHHKGDIELWVDTIYMICPFMARYGRVAQEREAYDDTAHQIKVQAKHLQDPHTDLFRHEWRETPDTYPESTYWSRGNGWAAAGILDTLEVLPDDHADRDRLVAIFRDLAGAVVEHQDTSGYWHNVLDDDQSPLETSGSLMFAYAFEKATDMGVLDDQRYVDAARRAMNVCKGVVDSRGRVRRVVGPPGGPDAPFAVTSYGQGWFLKAATQIYGDTPSSGTDS